MHEQSHQIFEILDSGESLKDCVLPSGQLSRRVDVMWLLVSGEVPLRGCVEFNHGLGKWVCVTLQSW